MENKKILQLGKYYPPKKGGIEQVSELISSSSPQGTRVYFVGFNSTNKTIVRRGGNGEIIIEFSLDILLARQPISLSLILNLQKIINKISPEVIIFHHPNPLLSFFLPNRKYVIWNHGTININKTIYKLYKKFEDDLFKNALCVFNSSPIVCRKNSSSNVIIPFTISEDNFKISEKVDVPQQKFIFTYARHVPYKGLDYLIKAFKKSNFKGNLIIGGTGPETERLKELSGTSRIIFVGNLKYSQITWLFKNADCFIFSSINNSETFGITLLESMYNSCAILKFEIPESGSNWVCPKNICINVGIPSLENLITGLNSLENMPHLELIKLGKLGKERYNEIFSAVKVKNQLKYNLKQIL